MAHNFARLPLIFLWEVFKCIFTHCKSQQSNSSLLYKIVHICDRIWENQPVSEKADYCVRGEIDVRALRR